MLTNGYKRVIIKTVMLGRKIPRPCLLSGQGSKTYKTGQKYSKRQCEYSLSALAVQSCACST